MHRRLPGASGGIHAGGVHKGEGYGSNRSREGPHPPSPRRWPAERRRRRAGPSRLARSKGSPAHGDDDGREQKGNLARPRSRPHVVTPADPGSGIRLPTTDSSRLHLHSRPPHGRRKNNPAEGGAQVLGRTNSKGPRARSTASIPDRPRGSARPENIFGGGSSSRAHENRTGPAVGLQTLSSARPRESGDPGSWIPASAGMNGVSYASERLHLVGASTLKGDRKSTRLNSSHLG